MHIGWIATAPNLSLQVLKSMGMTFGSTLRQDRESTDMQLIYAIAYVGLLAYRRENRYSADILMQRNQ